MNLNILYLQRLFSTCQWGDSHNFSIYESECFICIAKKTTTDIYVNIPSAVWYWASTHILWKRSHTGTKNSGVRCWTGIIGVSLFDWRAVWPLSVLHRPGAVSLQCLSADLDTSAVATQPVLHLTEGDQEEGTEELNKRGERVTTGGRMSQTRRGNGRNEERARQKWIRGKDGGCRMKVKLLERETGLFSHCQGETHEVIVHLFVI